MEKISIGKDVAEAIESYLEYNDKRELMLDHEEDTLICGSWSPITRLTFDELGRALYCGYTVKQSPEEVIQELYEDHKRKFVFATHYSPTESFHNGFMQGVKQTLEALGKTVDGVPKP